MSAPRIFDRDLYRLRRTRAARMASDRFLVTEAAEGIADRIRAVNRRFGTALEIASRPESAAILAPLADHWTRLALCPAEGGTVIGDEEALPFATDRFDLVVSPLSLHAVNDLPGALVQIRRILKPDGLFVAALFGGDTLVELRAAFAAAEMTVRGGISPRVAPFADVRTLGGLLQRAGYALPVSDSETTCVDYREFKSLIADLRALGEDNCLAERERKAVSRALYAALVDNYRTLCATGDGRLRATFDIVYLTGWAPHESQPQPLKPGSAQTSLAAALGSREIKLPD